MEENKSTHFNFPILQGDPRNWPLCTPKTGILFKAFAKAKTIFKFSDKTESGRFAGSMLISINAIYAATVDGLDANGLTAVQGVVTWDTKDYMFTLLGHESDQWFISSITELKPSANLPDKSQAFGCSRSYMARYQLYTLFGIANDKEDPDFVEQKDNQEQQEIKEPKKFEQPEEMPMTSSNDKSLTEKQMQKILKEMNGKEELFAKLMEQAGATTVKALTIKQASYVIGELLK